MATSMTGYGKSEVSNESYNLKIEIKSVNHRYRNISIKMPYHLNHLEDHIKSLLEQYIKRGTLDVYINLDYLDDSSIDVQVDMSLATGYYNAFKKINDELKLEDKITLNHIIAMRDVLITEKKEIEDDNIVGLIDEGIRIALTELVNMRNNEGERLKLDILNKIDIIENYVDLINDKAPIVTKEYEEKLRKNIASILEDKIPVDEDKLHNEVAYFIDKSSIDEEIVRFRSHIDQFKNIIETEDTVGRKLDFLLQEINREVNTIGSKSSNVEISENVVNIKSELEKIREQIQNIE